MFKNVNRRREELPYRYMVDGERVIFKNRLYEEIYSVLSSERLLKELKKMAMKDSLYFYNDGFTEKEKLKVAELVFNLT